MVLTHKSKMKRSIAVLKGGQNLKGIDLFVLYIFHSRFFSFQFSRKKITLVKIAQNYMTLPSKLMTHIYLYEYHLGK